MDVVDEMFGRSAAGDAANTLTNEVVAVELASVLPRVLIVSRRTVRKNKFVDFVGEYHLDLIVRYGAVPVIVPRVTGLHSLLDSFEPIHGVLLCEGEDIDPVHYDSNMSNLSAEEMEEIRRTHSSDTSIDKDKDSIELQLARLCLERNIPYLGICRGSQVLNVACGGSLYQDVEKELSSKVGVNVKHIDYENYDGHRHPVKVVQGTPLHEWFKTSLEEKSNDMELIVNSYHHQGVRRLAERFTAMAHAPDGLIEAFYDPDVCNPDQGKFIVGLQFHPERMRHDDLNDPSSEGTFDYPECPRVYQEFVGAVVAYQKRLLASGKERERKIDEEMERRRQQLIRSFSIAKSIYEEEEHAKKSHESIKEGARSQSMKELEVGAQFLQMSTILDLERSQRLKQMGATVRSSSAILAKLRMNKLKHSSAKTFMQGVSNQDIMELLEFYKMMLEVGHEVLANRGASTDHKTSYV